MWLVNNFICDYPLCCKEMITGMTQDDPEEVDLDNEPFKNYTMV